MQNLWRLIVAILLGFGSIQAAEVVRLVTWNLEWFPGKKPFAIQQERNAHFLEVAAILPQFAADVIVLQEVRSWLVAEDLAKVLPGFSVHVISAFKDPFTRKPGEQQICILSRLPADAAWAEEWKAGWANAPRGYAYARLKVGKHFLHVYGLHLKSNLGEPSKNIAKREDAINQLVTHICETVPGSEPVAVVGDFNTSKEQAIFSSDHTLTKIEQAGFFWTFEGIPLERRITIPGKGRYPDACFDHIFTRNLGRPVGQVKDSSGSDHRPVFVDIVIGD
jgi:endonuclease/exonuclease/phosphatase family metal-dependent hydrolase